MQYSRPQQPPRLGEFAKPFLKMKIRTLCYLDDPDVEHDEEWANDSRKRERWLGLLRAIEGAQRFRFLKGFKTVKT